MLQKPLSQFQNDVGVEHELMNEEAVEYPPGCQPISLASNNHELIKRLRVSNLILFWNIF